MRCSSKGLTLVFLTLLCTCCFISENLFGHGGRFRKPVKVSPDDPSNPGGDQAATEKGIVFPGGGPQMPFSEGSWEYWWDFNSDPLIDLKPTLFKLTPGSGSIDYPFEKIAPEEKREKLVRFFTKILREESEATVREAAVIALARTQDEGIVPYLQLTYENDPNLYVRTMAVIALGISQNQAAVPILKYIFEDKKASTEIRSYAALGMGLVGGKGANDQFKAWLDPRYFKKSERLIQQSIAFGAGLTEDSTLAPLVRSALTNKLTDDKVTISYFIQSLGRLGDRAANALVLKYLTDKTTYIRRSAAVALGAAASPSDKDVVAGLIATTENDADNMVRNFAYIALGSIGGETAETFLMKELNQVTRTRLPFVALAVGLTRNPAHGPKMLEKFIDIKDVSTRSALAVSLGLLNHKEALGELRKAVDRIGEPGYRGYMALALGLMKDNESVERLSELYENSVDVELSRFCAIALGLIGDRTITETMRELLGPKTLDNVRWSTAYNLGLIGDKNAVEALKTLATDPNENKRLRQFAIVGLGLLGADSPWPVVSKITRDANYTILDNFIYELYNIN